MAGEQELTYFHDLINLAEKISCLKFTDCLYIFLFHLLSSCFCHYYPVEGNNNKLCTRPSPQLWEAGPGDEARVEASVLSFLCDSKLK